MYSYWNAWANLHLLGQPNTFLTQGFFLDWEFGLGNNMSCWTPLWSRDRARAAKLFRFTPRPVVCRDCLCVTVGCRS